MTIGGMVSLHPDHQIDYIGWIAWGKLKEKEDLRLMQILDERKNGKPYTKNRMAKEIKILMSEIVYSIPSLLPWYIQISSIC